MSGSRQQQSQGMAFYASWRFLALAAVLCGLGAAIPLMSEKPAESGAEIILHRPSQSPLALADWKKSILDPALTAKVSRRLALAADPEYGSRKTTGWNLIADLLLGDDPPAGDAEELAVRRLSENMRVETGQAEDAVLVKITDPSVERAAAILATYVDAMKTEPGSANPNAAGQSFAAARADLEHYVASAGQSNVDIALESERQIGEHQKELDTVNQRLAAGGATLADQAATAAAATRLAKAEAALAGLSDSLGPLHPARIAAAKERDAARAELDQKRKLDQSAAERQMVSLRQRKQELERQLQADRVRLSASGVDMARYHDLDNRVSKASDAVTTASIGGTGQAGIPLASALSPVRKLAGGYDPIVYFECMIGAFAALFAMFFFRFARGQMIFDAVRPPVSGLNAPSGLSAQAGWPSASFVQPDPWSRTPQAVPQDPWQNEAWDDPHEIEPLGDIGAGYDDHRHSPPDSHAYRPRVLARATQGADQDIALVRNELARLRSKLIERDLAAKSRPTSRFPGSFRRDR